MLLQYTVCMHSNNTTKPGIQLLSPNVNHMCHVAHITSVWCDVIHMTAFSVTEILFTLWAQIINFLWHRDMYSGTELYGSHVYILRVCVCVCVCVCVWDRIKQ